MQKHLCYGGITLIITNMKKSCPNYPFVEPSFAKLLEKKKYGGSYDAVYDKGYRNNNKKVKPKLLKTGFGVKIKSIIDILNNSKMRDNYYKRPEMFEDSVNLPIWCMKAPTYHQILDWLFQQFNIFVSIRVDNTYGFFWEIVDIKSKKIIDDSTEYFYCPKQALKICLETFVKTIKI